RRVSGSRSKRCRGVWCGAALESESPLRSWPRCTRYCGRTLTEPALPADLIAILGGAVAGCLGALVGIGGGVVLVPVLNDLIGLSFRQATAASLVGVLATSSSAAIVPIGRRLHNTRLA